MKRRKLVALVAVFVFVLLGIVGVSTFLFLTRTESGRSRVRSIVQPLVAGKVKGGQLYIGRIAEISPSEITIDTIAIRDKRGELFISTGRVTVAFDLRDIIDQRLHFRRAQIEHPYVHLIQHENDSWNFREIFASQNNGPPEPKDLTRRSFGDYIVIDSARTRNGTFLITLPWRVDKSLKGAARDSVIRYHLETPSKAVSKTFDGYGRLYAWRNLRGLLTHARLADPDSDKAYGKEFNVDSLAADEFEPTFRFRNVRAFARVLGDSVFFQVPHFNLPSSIGNGHGKVWWGNGPVRYDIAVRGDSVALEDVNWVYPTLPKTGGGSLDLFIKNDPKNPQILEFKLSKMDVKSTKSHLLGDMSFGIGMPVLLVRNVDLRADPVDFDLIRTLNGKPFPMDWQGQLIGTAKGPGGPLTNFVVSEAHGTFNDKHVPGAVSRFSANGELDILYPALTAFHNFHVDVASLDLRTPEFLNPNFPRLGGTISGVATLDSSWLDVRFSNADILHRDGPGEPSRFTGGGRVTYDTLMIYDVSVEAKPLSLTMLARSYPNPLRGLVSGPIHVKGVAPDLDISTSLQNSVAGFSFDGRIDADSVGGYGARGRGQFTTPNVGGLLSMNQWLVGQLGVHYDVDVAGISATQPGLVRGTAALDVDRTVLDSVAYRATRLRLSFENGEMHVDSTTVKSSAGNITVAGGISLPKVAPRDSIRFSVDIDSLGGLRPYISHPDTTLLGAANTPVDSLSGEIKLTKGRLTGSLDSLNVAGVVNANSLYINKDRGERGELTFDLRNILGNYSGNVKLAVDSLRLGGIALDTIGGSLTLADSSHGKFDARAISHTGPKANASGDWARMGDTTSLRMNEFALNVGDARWRLSAPAHFAFDTIGTRLDSLLLRNADSGSIVARANIPEAGNASVDLRALHVPLRDIGEIAQLTDTLAGTGNLAISVAGPRLRPRVTADAELLGVRWYGVDVDRVGLNARAENARVEADLQVTRAGKPAITAKANLPVEVTLFTAKARDETISGTLHAEPTDLGLLNAALTRAKTTLAGQMRADVTLAGTWLKPTLEGTVRVIDGQAKIAATGVPINDINGSATWTRNARGEDSVVVALNANDERTGTISLDGFAKNLLQSTKGQAQPLRFTLTANGFHAFKKNTLADLYVSTPDPLRLTGTIQAATLGGSVNVDRGSIFLADRDIARKQGIETIEETNVTEESKSKVFSTLMTNLQPNVTITLGDVRLRSAEANVRLTGNLQLTTSTARSNRVSVSNGQLLPQFALEGQLTTAGGTYGLNLGVARREFKVLGDGTVTFDGPWQNPNLDIRAQYDVRRQGDKDLGIIVTLNGPLIPYPGIDFSSNAGYEISQSDLISYLITGKPGFDFGANPQAAQVISSFVGPSLSALAADKLRATPLGSLIDVFRFQLGSTNTSAGAVTNNQTNWSQYLYGSTIDVEQQFKNVSLSANVGFCQFQQSTSNFNALNALGAKAEYRFKPELSLKLSYDPPAAQRACTGQTLITGFQQTPWQLGLSLLHTWRF